MFHLFFLCLILVGTGPNVWPSNAELATIKNNSVTESSGLVASRTLPGAYWTHNDSGDGPFIYAFNTRGESLAVFRVTGANARDWEDIAAGPGPQRNRSYLYIGDIGDNSAKRSEIVVYRIPEPDLKSANRNSAKSRPLATENAEAIRLKYPDGKHDAETLLVHPVNRQSLHHDESRVCESGGLRSRSALERRQHDHDETDRRSPRAEYLWRRDHRRQHLA